MKEQKNEKKMKEKSTRLKNYTNGTKRKNDKLKNMKKQKIRKQI